MYWWNEEIAKIRKEANTARRARQRERQDMQRREALEEKFREARKKLKKAIRRSKEQQWASVLEEVEGNLWGEGYKIVTKRLKARQAPPNLPMEELERVAVTLFPEHAIPRYAHEEEGEIHMEEDDQFSTEEVMRSARKIKIRKAPGPDGIPPEAVKAVVEVGT